MLFVYKNFSLVSRPAGLYSLKQLNLILIHKKKNEHLPVTCLIFVDFFFSLSIVLFVYIFFFFLLIVIIYGLCNSIQIIGKFYLSFLFFCFKIWFTGYRCFFVLRGFNISVNLQSRSINVSNLVKGFKCISNQTNTCSLHII